MDPITVVLRNTLIPWSPLPTLVLHMKRRSNVYLDATVVDYLHSYKLSISEIANIALREKAIELGYNDLDNQIVSMKRKLGKLCAYNVAHKKDSELEESFYLKLVGYMQTRGISSKTLARDIISIRGWLTGPANKEYSSIIGHPQQLTEEKINELIARAYTYRDGNESKED